MASTINVNVTYMILNRPNRQPEQVIFLSELLILSNKKKEILNPFRDKTNPLPLSVILIDPNRP